METSSEGIMNYHERTKHQPRRYARSAGYLDWASEPDPFRRYKGTPLIPLPVLEKDPDGNYSSLFDRKNIETRPFTLRRIASFLELSLGLSAWKSFKGNTWALRINPSSGNLHPTESYLVLPPFEGGPGGVFHYNPLLHGLEQRATINTQFWSRVTGHFGTQGFLVGLSSIHWRESWKYGERAFRYSHLDLGHALAALSFSAALLGWRVTCLNALSSGDVEAILGFAQTGWKKHEQEEPGPLLFVHRADSGTIPRGMPDSLITAFRDLTFSGEPNPLSARHRDWNVIEEVSTLTAKPPTQEQTFRYRDDPYSAAETPALSGAQVIRKRRSGLDFDAKKSPMRRENFLAILDRTIPRSRCAPFDVEFCEPAVHLVLFVHRVAGLEQGLYFFVRNESDFEEIRRRCGQKWLWKKVSGGSGTLSLYLLEMGDFRSVARDSSCEQDIASDGSFGAAMIARFRDTIEREPYRYRHLHWEAGMIGQVLYLGAEAASLRGTGMGCFFDDVVHELLGFSGTAFQDLYHFGAGFPAEDPRIATLPPYHHLPESRKS
jgi:SagB-type dehydrogenase family enzyme